MISLKFKVACDKCHVDLGDSTCLVRVLGDGTIQLVYPEELPPKGGHLVLLPGDGGWSVHCKDCYTRYRPCS